MCTAFSVSLKNHYFGRNLDYEHTFGEKIIITPRNYEFRFSDNSCNNHHSAIIGIGIESDGYPLYFDAVNENGLCIAGLNFPDNAFYFDEKPDMLNIASFELIPRLLTECKTINDVRQYLSKINITNIPFSDKFAPSPLHWIISDKTGSLTLEQTSMGLNIYENSVGVLANNPAFDIQMFNLSNYMSVSAEEPQNMFSDKVNLKPYSRGMGGVGIPGDMSSMSRFVRGCFTKLNSVFGDTEEEIINQFFHILNSVYQIKGCVKVGDKYEITNYSCCCNSDRGIYYYTTYNNFNIRSVDMYKENIEINRLILYEL